jgi:phosphoribosylanthranilate isomerase
MKIKVCGIQLQQQVDELENEKIDFIGFIFYPKSKRFVGDNLYSIKNNNLKPTAVFVNATEEEIKDAILQIPTIKALQLHGNESAEFCKKYSSKFEIIKAFGINENSKIEELIAPYIDAVDYFLFDTKTELHGGSGTQFDWKILEKCKIPKPFFLSGGIGLEDVEKIKKFNHPNFYGVDVNSKFELSPGNKNMGLVKQFIQQL